jgi:acetyl esterase
VLVFFHGGGWVIGDVESYDATCRQLANASGCVLVSVEYRRAPEAKYPAAADDAYAATVYVAAHAEEFNADADRLAVGGDSAGGNLAAVVSQMARDRGGPAIKFQLLVYPATDFNFETASYRDNAEGYLLTVDAMRWFWGLYLSNLDDGAQAYASPLRASSLSNLPPAHIMTAEFVPLRDEGEAYAAALAKAGGKATVHRYDGMIHGFFQWSPMIAQSRALIEESGAVLREALGVPSAARS